MTTLEKAARQALEALKSSRVFVTTREKIKHPEGTEAYDEIIASLRQALEQKQEPVGEVNRHGLDSHGRKWHGIHWYDANVDVPHGTKLYTEPPKREWVGLTPNERWDLWNNSDQNNSFSFANAVENKLRDKNA